MAYGDGGNASYGHNPNPYTTSYGAQGGADSGGFMGGSQGASQPTGKVRQVRAECISCPYQDSGWTSSWTVQCNNTTPIVTSKAPNGYCEIQYSYSWLTPHQGTYGKDTLRPLTVFQVLEAEQPHPDADFKIDDVEISQISLVGQIRNISKQTTNMTYRLDDGTGTVEVKVWIDTDAPTHDETGRPLPHSKAPLAEGDWAKVWGKLKSFNNRRHVGAFSMKRVQDMNEINYHLLEATYVHLYFTKGPMEDSNGQANGQANGGANQADTTMQDADAGGATGYNRALPRMGAHAQKVYNALLHTPQGHEGLHVQNIAAAAGLSVADVQKGGDELMGHALIFTTLDDNTWALMSD